VTAKKSTNFADPDPKPNPVAPGERAARPRGPGLGEEGSEENYLSLSLLGSASTSAARKPAQEREVAIDPRQKKRATKAGGGRILPEAG